MTLGKQARSRAMHAWRTRKGPSWEIPAAGPFLPSQGACAAVRMWDVGMASPCVLLAHTKHSSTRVSEQESFLAAVMVSQSQKDSCAQT